MDLFPFFLFFPPQKHTNNRPYNDNNNQITSLASITVSSAGVSFIYVSEDEINFEMLIPVPINMICNWLKYLSNHSRLQLTILIETVCGLDRSVYLIVDRLTRIMIIGRLIVLVVSTIILVSIICWIISNLSLDNTLTWPVVALFIQLRSCRFKNQFCFPLLLFILC